MDFELKISGKGNIPEGPERGESKQSKVPHGEVKAGFRKILENQKDTGESFSADELADLEEASLSEEELAVLKQTRRTPGSDKGHPGLHKQDTTPTFSQVRQKLESQEDNLRHDEKLATDLHSKKTQVAGLSAETGHVPVAPKRTEATPHASGLVHGDLARSDLAKGELASRKHDASHRHSPEVLTGKQTPLASDENDTRRATLHASSSESARKIKERADAPTRPISHERHEGLAPRVSHEETGKTKAREDLPKHETVARDVLHNKAPGQERPQTDRELSKETRHLERPLEQTAGRTPLSRGKELEGALASASDDDFDDLFDSEEIVVAPGKTEPRGQVLADIMQSPLVQSFQNVESSARVSQPQVMADLVTEMVHQISQVSFVDRTETLVTLAHPPMFEGAQVLIREFNQAKGEFSVSFHGLSPEASALLLERTNQRLLQDGFERRGLTVHVLQVSQAHVAETYFTSGGQSDNFREKDREGESKEKGSGDQKDRRQR